jgi:hypothetical protein
LQRGLNRTQILANTGLAIGQKTVVEKIIEHRRPLGCRRV